MNRPVRTLHSQLVDSLVCACLQNHPAVHHGFCAILIGKDRTGQNINPFRRKRPDGADLILDEVYIRDKKLYGRFIEDGNELTCQLYPIGKNTFGRKGGFSKIEFGENQLTLNGVVCKKL